MQSNQSTAALSSASIYLIFTEKEMKAKRHLNFFTTNTSSASRSMAEMANVHLN
jgi:hypothetical protein